MTAKELKVVLDKHIRSLTITNGSDNAGFYILLAPHHYEKAWHSCTTDEKDFQFIKGKVLYKGFELSKFKGLSPYKK